MHACVYVSISHSHMIQPSSRSPQSQEETDLYKELDARRKRLKELGAVVAKMQTKKNLMTVRFGSIDCCLVLVVDYDLPTLTSIAV